MKKRKKKAAVDHPKKPAENSGARAKQVPKVKSSSTTVPATKPVPQPISASTINTAPHSDSEAKLAPQSTAGSTLKTSSISTIKPAPQPKQDSAQIPLSTSEKREAEEIKFAKSTTVISPYKTKLCFFYNKTGSCKRGKDCHFIHAEQGDQHKPGYHQKPFS